jgi:DHA2 family multidrug resistance protein-like MFS transporter
MAPGTTSMVMSSVSQARAGMASGAQSTTRQLGGALGVAALGSILAAQYSSNLARTLAATPAANYLPDARRSLAGALQAAPAGSAAERIVTALAKDAFVDGMHIAATLTACLAAIAAGLVFVALRPRPATSVETNSALNVPTYVTLPEGEGNG